MISLEDLVKIAKEELTATLTNFFEEVGSSLAALLPGLLFRPFLFSLGATSTAVFDAVGNLAQAIQQVPLRVAARAILLNVQFKGSTRVCKLSDAQQFAADLALSAVFELSGGGPTSSVKKGLKLSKFKGAKKRLIAVEERQAIGTVLSKLLGILRAPSRFLVLLLQQLWTIVVAIAAIGAIFTLWTIASADFSAIALSQNHPRKILRLKVNKRL